MSRDRRDDLSTPASEQHRNGGRRLLTLAEAAELLGLSVASIRRLVWAGKLPVVRLTRRIQIDTRDLERLIQHTKDRSAW